MVVVAGELVELGLQLGHGCGPGLLAQPAFEGLVEAFDLAAGLRVVGAGVPVGDRHRANSSSIAQRPPPRGAAVKTAPLSEGIDAGNPLAAAAWWKLATTSAALVVGRAWLATSKREWSSTRLRTSTCRPAASLQWVMSACQRWLGISAWNRT
jgi:hypothetical protein